MNDSTPPSPTGRPGGDQRPSKALSDADLADRGRLTSEVWSGESGTKVLGPCHRSRLDADGLVAYTRKYYRITYPDPARAAGRGFAEAATKTKALKRAKTIDANLTMGLPPSGAPNEDRSISELIDAYLDPANHRGSWTADRSAQAPASFLNTWVRPAIGHLLVREWTPSHSEAILHTMVVAHMDASYQAQGHTYLRALATFAKKRTHGFLHPNADPLADVTRPKAATEAAFVPPETLPTFDHVHAFAVTLGEIVRKRFSRGRMTPAKKARASLEALRWAMLPLIIAYFGLRPNAALALRTTDFILTDRAAGLGCRVERQAKRGSATQTILPKHGSVRTTYAPDQLWDEIVDLVSQLERAFGRGCLVWSQKGDITRMVSDSTLSKSYFTPAAEVTPGWESHDKLQWTVEEDANGTIIASPILDMAGRQVVRREWNWSWRQLRHLYGTTSLAKVENGGWGQDITDVSDRMGHKTSEVTWTYYVKPRRGGGGRMAAATGGGHGPVPDGGLELTASRPRLRLVQG